MKSMLERGITIGICIFIALVPIAANQSSINENHSYERNPSLSAIYTEFSILELRNDVWNRISIDRIKNYTRDLSVNYPNRVWSSTTMEPSTNLEQAWDWANQTMKQISDQTIEFHQITDYKILIAVKNGEGPSPRSALVVTGVISSGLSPGANSGAGSVAAVFEVADALQEYSLAFDVYYVLINRDFMNTEYDLGSRAFVSWLDENGINTYTTITFEKILYGVIEQTFRNTTSVRTSPYTQKYQESDWLPQLMIQVSREMGSGRLRQPSDVDIAQLSCAYEMWRVERPAVHVAQGFWPDLISGTEDDVWNNQEYNYGKAGEAVSSVTSVLVYLGMLGNNEVGVHQTDSILSPQESIEQLIIMSSSNYINSTISWDNDTTVKAQIINALTDDVVYERIENDRLIVMKYLSHHSGHYYIKTMNIGQNTTEISVNSSYIEDCDGDSLSDLFELSLGTNVYYYDTDADGLTDDFELEFGTNPLDADSDGDGALDMEEFITGSSLLLPDSDGDGLLDGLEFDLGTDPTDIDTDDDGLTDFQEIEEFLTNPLSSDTDFDGLEDGFETEAGLNPLSPDSDGDSLSDLFEILNLLNPLSQDTDGDGWGDSYEVEYCLSPTDTDSDDDGIPDGIDWDPREHWLNAVAPVGLISTILMLIVFSYLKYRLYQKTD
jgi:acid phosphatase family membrane protein YuiD